MQRPFLLSLLAVFALALFARPTLALPPLSKQFLETYKKTKIFEAASKAKCNVCHYGKSKKNRNDYGKAVNEFFKKADYAELKKEPDKLKAAIEKAFEKAEAKKSVSKETFAAKIKAGKLPGTAPAVTEEPKK